MKSVGKLLAAGALVVAFGLHPGLRVNAAGGSHETAVTTVSPLSTTPRFDRFLLELQSFRWNVLRWTKVVHPTLLELQYSKPEIAQIRKALQESRITDDQATVFCERWFQTHHERLVPRALQDFLARRTGADQE